MRGFTLTELLVAMTLSLLLISGALNMHVSSKRQLLRAETITDLDERATFAMTALLADLRMAGYWGLHARGSDISVSADIGAHCGGQDVSSWAFTLAEGVAINAAAPCPIWLRDAGSSDTVTIRRVSGRAAMPEAGQIQLEATVAGGELFADGVPPTGADGTRVHDLRIHHWFVSSRSSEPGRPALRRLTLGRNGLLADEEVMPGVEHLSARIVQNTAGEIVGVDITLRVVDTIRDDRLAGPAATDGLPFVEKHRFIALRNFGLTAS